MVIKPKKFNIDNLKKSYSKYNLTTREFTCKYSQDKGVFIYYLLAGKKNSGKRGGHLLSRRDWYFENLYPEQRLLIEQLPKEK